ncbi:hypothetical protein IT570_04810 [Candidatus Sumerlaeota bacterium]|nr:hypothetical protein [Candidatus Sumerlaeota bacterium]
MRFRTLLVLTLISACALSSCARVKRDRCYLEETRYMEMRAIFEQTSSYQRVAQAMKDEGWAHCEVNQFRYRLRKDLLLDEPEFDALFASEEPPRSELDFNPGRVEHLPKDKVRKK